MNTMTYLRLDSIEHRHPKAVSKTYSREQGDVIYTTSDFVMTTIADGVKTLWIDADEEYFILALRISTLGAGRLGYVVDICKRDIIIEIDTWCQRELGYGRPEGELERNPLGIDLRIEHYIRWAKAHKVWP